MKAQQVESNILEGKNLLTVKDSRLKQKINRREKKMAEYWISLTLYFPRDSKPVFLGEFENKSEAIAELQKAEEFDRDVEFIKASDSEILQELRFLKGKDYIPRNQKNSVIIDLLTGTQAKRTGGKNFEKSKVGKDITVALEDLGLEMNDQANIKEEPIATFTGVQNGISYHTPPAPTVIVTEKPKVGNGGNRIAKREAVKQSERSEATIYTKFDPNVELLHEFGVWGEVNKGKAYPNDILGRRIIATLPSRLLSLAKEHGEIDLPKITGDMQGKTFTLDDLHRAQARLRWFRTIEMEGDWGKFFDWLDENEGNFNKVMRLVEEDDKK